ncbi:MAG TPA: RHS repeat-associated core domain-containing protein [Chitinophagaceae bacterium]|nr:RHS repeat-associated core domain-containing protein [Chitinophagaceae bacterium]
MPQTVSYNSRAGNVPLEYKASQSIEFITGFENELGDEFTAYITSEGSNESGNGVDGIEGLYRYGFNGKENDNEIKGEGAQQDYGMRIYDPRLGKFLSVDPLTEIYPWNSTYAFAENSPIENIDLDGLEKQSSRYEKYYQSTQGTKFKPLNERKIFNAVETKKSMCHGPANVEFRIPEYSNPQTFSEWWRKNSLGYAVETIDKVSDYVPNPKTLVKAGVKKIVKIIVEKNKRDQQKKVPNPHGKNGGPDHQERIGEVEKSLEKEGFDKIEKEVLVNTPGGTKQKRYIDVQGTNTKTGDVKQVQVGKENKDGSPVSSERKALDDVENATGTRPKFEPYNKKKDR